MVACCSQKSGTQSCGLKCDNKINIFLHYYSRYFVEKFYIKGVSLMAVRKEHRAETPELRLFCAVQIHLWISACAAWASLRSVHTF